MAKAVVEIKANKREKLGKKNKGLRAKGLVPAVVYGRKFQSTPISIDLRDFRKKVLLSDAGQNLIFTLKIAEDGKGSSIPVITHSIQRDALTDNISHIDFMHVIMDEKIKAKIKVELTGNPVGVKEDGGVLVHGMREIEVKCLPGDIPDKYELDVSGLKINESFHVSDLKISDKVEILVPKTEMLATVSPPTKEEVEEAAAAPLPEGAEAPEAAAAVAEEGVKEKTPPGAAPPKAAAAAKEEKPSEKGKK